MQSWDKSKIGALTAEFAQKITDSQHTAEVSVSKFFLASEIWELNKLNPQDFLPDRRTLIFEAILKEASELYQYDQEVQKSPVDPVLNRYKYVHNQGRASSSSHTEENYLQASRDASLKGLQMEREADIKIEHPKWQELKQLAAVLKGGKVHMQTCQQML